MKQKFVMFMLDPFILPRLEGIASYAHEHGWILFPEDRVDDDELKTFDGAIASLRGASRQMRRARTLLDLGKPVVDLTMEYTSIELPRVSSDHEACGRLAATHLKSLGIETFAWYASKDSNVNTLRQRGFADELGKQSRPIRLSSTTLHKALKSLPKPLGVATYSEPDAGKIISECERLSIDIPDDIAVIAIGNDPFLCENRDITISAIDTNMSLGGYEAARLLDSLMHSNRKSKILKNYVKLIPPIGVVPRKSTDMLSHPNPFIRDVLMYIHRNLATSFGAAEIAAAFKIPRTTFDRRFRESVGHSIGKEILDQRVKLAKQLLRNEDIPLKQLAIECGFCNQAFLTTTFKQQTGLTPARWRKGTPKFSAKLMNNPTSE